MLIDLLMSIVMILSLIAARTTGLGPSTNDEMLIQLSASTGIALPGVHHDPILDCGTGDRAAIGQGHDEGLAEEFEDKRREMLNADANNPGYPLAHKPNSAEVTTSTEGL